MIKPKPQDPKLTALGIGFPSSCQQAAVIWKTNLGNDTLTAECAFIALNKPNLWEEKTSKLNAIFRASVFEGLGSGV